MLHKNNILAFGRFIEGQSLNSLRCMINNGLWVVNFLSILTKPGGVNLIIIKGIEFGDIFLNKFTLRIES